MTIILIIVSIFLILSLLGNIISFYGLKVLVNDIIEEQQLEQELAFASGDIDIPEDEIAKKFLNAILLCHIEKNPHDDSTWKIIDISNYQKNQIIGLTYFVQPQLFQDFADDINSAKLKEQIYKKIVNKIYDDADDIDEDFVNELCEKALQEVLHDGGYEFETLLPHCTVYQLKDGRWVWRRESY